MASTRLSKGFGDGQPVAASRYHTRSRFLPAGVAPERGLQVRTILTARSISAEFPQIHEIGECDRIRCPGTPSAWRST